MLSGSLCRLLEADRGGAFFVQYEWKYTEI